MDTFLLCCDDENSDVRLMADECLNRTIKVTQFFFLSKFLFNYVKLLEQSSFYVLYYNEGYI